MKKLFFLLLSLVTLGACKKDSENAPSRVDLLTAKNWRPTTITISIATNGTTQSFSSLSACMADDFLKFNPDKSLVQDEGVTKCDPANPQTEKGTWAMPSDSKLTITLPVSSSFSVSGALYNGNGGGPYDVKELTATTMHLSSTAILGLSVYTYDVTMNTF